MLVHEYGDLKAPVILLLPGTACSWKANFRNVTDELSRDYRTAVVSYTGFDENDTETFPGMTEETGKIEDYVLEHYDGSILCAYGCSLGGSFVGLLAARGRIKMKYGILGSSDLDQAGKLRASLLGKLFAPLIRPLVSEGRFRLSFLQKRLEKRLAENDPYNRAFLSLTGAEDCLMPFLSEESLYNQFVSDLVTPLPEQIGNGPEGIHIFYAKKMGGKYLQRYRKHFKDPVIHEHDLRHEELLALYPQEWCALVKKICRGEGGAS